MHNEIDKKFPMPHADILLHTGDFTNHGSLEEIASFNNWLGKLKKKYAHIIVILGNHDTWGQKDTSIVRPLLSNATMLENEEIEVLGIRIYGSPWYKNQPAASPDKATFTSEMFEKIPQNVDILMTHGPAHGIFDLLGSLHSWGASGLLREAIEAKSPKVHLFGHLHEQRGVWYRETPDSDYKGGIEFEPWPRADNFPPPASYPCQLISNNAMKNLNNLDGLPSCIVGPPRLFFANMDDNKQWNFTLS